MRTLFEIFEAARKHGGATEEELLTFIQGGSRVSITPTIQRRMRISLKVFEGVIERSESQ